MPIRLLCDTNPMCYGSSAVLLSILDHLKVEATVMVEGITGEMIEADPAVNRCIHAPLKDPAALGRMLINHDYDGVLVISNTANIDLYLRRAWPLFFVDILYWFGRNKSHSGWSEATISFAQRFPGVVERVETVAGSCRPTLLVGPLVRTPPKPTAPATGTLVNLGGVKTRWDLPGSDRQFAEMIAQAVIQAGDALPHPVFIAAGGNALEALSGLTAPSWLTWGSLPQHLYLERVSSSDLFVTVPGLSAVFERLQTGAPMLMLPPQNATKVTQLHCFESEGMVPRGLDPGHLLGEDRLPDPSRSDEQESTRAVQDALARLCRRGDAADRIANHLQTQVLQLDAMSRAQSRFSRWLGPPGSAEVADRIHRWYVSKS